MGSAGAVGSSGERCEALGSGPQGLHFLAEREAYQTLTFLRVLTVEHARGNSGDLALLDELAREGAVVSAGQGCEVGKNEVRALGNGDRESYAAQRVDQEVPALLVLRAQGFVVVGAEVPQRGGDGVLQGSGRRERHELVRGLRGCDERRRPSRPSYLPPRERIGLPCARQGQRALSHPGQRCHRHVLRPVVGQVLVDFVGDDVGIVALAQRGDRGELVAGEDLPRGVVRRVEQHELGSIVEHGGELVFVQSKVGKAQGTEARDRTCERGAGRVAVVEGLEHHDLVAWIEQPQQRRRDAFGCATEDDDLSHRVVVQVVASPLVFGDGFDEGDDAHGSRVLVVPRAQGIDSRLEDRGGSIEVGEALGEIDGPVLHGEGGHLAEDRGSKGFELLRDHVALHGRVADGFMRTGRTFVRRRSRRVNADDALLAGSRAGTIRVARDGRAPYSASRATIAPRRPSKATIMTDSRTPPPAIQKGITLETFVLEGFHNRPGATGAFTSLLNQLGTAVKIISARVRNAGLADVLGYTGETNVQGERVQILDQYANDVLVNVLERRGHCRAVASEEMAEPLLTSPATSARYVVLFDPIDGSSNIDVGVSIGTIFAILRTPTNTDASTTGNLLRPGRELVAAGYALYGSQTMLVLSTGLRDGVHGFTFDPSVGEFFLSHENVRCPERGDTYSINEGNRASWPDGVRRWNDWIKEPGEDPSRPYAQRYVGSFVADAHRTLLKGGIFVYPPDAKNPVGKLRLLYEANPLAFLFEAAGGVATDGTRRILDIQPSSVHERTAIALGSKRDVEAFRTFVQVDHDKR